ncbi:class I SAM-dependent methyltransferase [Streptomyces sp. NPDC056500]|uniref:class I SAM-dependent methyltransferase n=1 Tax=Streptomyces sp. NPDC056500 TaxID=3345840 RepID=UPI0036C6E892
MSVTSRYRDAWEGFWAEVPDEPGAVFWDAEPALTASRHLARYEPLVEDAGLTMVDLGCGNGTQTRFLADRFPAVLGLDLADAAIDLARRQQEKARPSRCSGLLSFRTFDAVDMESVARLHEEVGDCNVYVRGVLHQADPGDRQHLAEAVGVLVGERGRAFVVELTEVAGTRLAQLVSSPSGPPAKLLPVFRHGIVPGALPDEELIELFARSGLSTLASGDLPLITTEYELDGSRVELPSKWLVLGRPR